MVPSVQHISDTCPPSRQHITRRATVGHRNLPLQRQVTQMLHFPLFFNLKIEAPTAENQLEINKSDQFVIIETKEDQNTLTKKKRALETPCSSSSSSEKMSIISRLKSKPLRFPTGSLAFQPVKFEEAFSI